MAIPVYVVTGFLDSGKTTFINDLLKRLSWRKINILVIQFETGEEAFFERDSNCQCTTFSKKTLEQHPEEISEQICEIINTVPPDEIWIEWNGVVAFSQLQSLLLHSSLRDLCKIDKVFHIADADNIENLLGKTGAALPEQIASCDFAVVRNIKNNGQFKKLSNIFRGINPGLPMYQIKDYNDLYRQLFKKREHPVNTFVILILACVLISLIIKPVLDVFDIPINTVVNVFLGILLQAVPFLLIGVIISSAIQVFIPQDMIQRRFPKSVGMGIVVAILSGFCLPVCDCASIPIFRSLVKRGVPLSAAVAFMTATPVINPVVMLSTYYAFNGNTDIVIGRVCMGIVAAALIGFSFAIKPPKGNVLPGGSLDRLMCSCGCYEDSDSITTLSGKMGLFIRHSQIEFFNVGKYMVIGTFVSTIFQTLGTDMYTAAQSGAGLVLSILIMMVMAFVLSLCSSSDAVIARSFSNQFPMGALMGFLVFGPMMDIKNVLMLSSGVSKRFIVRLLVTAFVICFAVVFAFYGIGGF